MRDLQDQRDLLVQLVPLAPLDLLALLVTLERGVLLVKLVYLGQMASLDLLDPPSCCLSGSDRAEEIRVLLFLRRKLRLQPSCLRPGWL